MASMAFTTSFTKIQAINRFSVILGKPCSSMLFTRSASQTSRRGYSTRATFDEAAKKGRDAAIKGGQQLKKEASAAADNSCERVDDIAGKAQEAASKAKQVAQDAAGKVKQTAEGAWDSVKETTQKIKDTVVGKAEESADSAKGAIKEGAAKLDRTINSK